jgi:hypothetical protein
VKKFLLILLIFNLGYMANFAVASDEEVAERPVKTPRNSLEQGHPATPRGSLEQLPPPPTSPSTEESSPSEDAGSDDDEFSDKKSISKMVEIFLTFYDRKEIAS